MPTQVTSGGSTWSLRLQAIYSEATPPSILQCRYLIPALNAWAAGAYYTAARPIATSFPGHGFDHRSLADFTTERSFDLLATVPAFNSCTECRGRPSIIHSRTPDCHPVSWEWMRPEVPYLTIERSFDSQATWFIDVLGSFC